MRPGPTRVATYCSKVLVKVPRWRRSKASTAMSCCTPESASAMTPCETPAARASAETFWTKLLKSPPQRAANAGVAAMQAPNRIPRQSFRMSISLECLVVPGHVAPIMRPDRRVRQNATSLLAQFRGLILINTRLPRLPHSHQKGAVHDRNHADDGADPQRPAGGAAMDRSEEHTSELQSRPHLV